MSSFHRALKTPWSGLMGQVLFSGDPRCTPRHEVVHGWRLLPNFVARRCERVLPSLRADDPFWICQLDQPGKFGELCLPQTWGHLSIVNCGWLVAGCLRSPNRCYHADFVLDFLEDPSGNIRSKPFRRQIHYPNVRASAHAATGASA